MQRKYVLFLVVSLSLIGCDTEEPTIDGPTEEAETVDRFVKVMVDEGEVTPDPEPKDAEAKQGKSGEGTLSGDAIGELRGAGGLGKRSGGRGGGGVSERGPQLANVGAVGKGGGARGGSGYGMGNGDLGDRRARPSRSRARRSRTDDLSAALETDIFGSGAGRGTTRSRIDTQTGGTEQYTHHGTNAFVDASEDRLSTFAVDVDTGSYTITRQKLTNGHFVPASSVRVEEFVNYFDYAYPGPKSGPFSVSMEAAPSPFSTSGDTVLMRVGVQGKTIADKARKPVHLTFLVDVSGSMQGPRRIGLVKRSLHVLADNLRPGDTVAIATYSATTRVVLEPTGMNRRQRIFDAIDELSAGGSTAMGNGLELAYRLADKKFKRDHENRVIVLSDGDANGGSTSWEEMLSEIGSQVKKGVTLSTIGFGMGNYKDTRMEQLANNGNGNYFYVDSEREAQKIFGEQLDGTLQVIAKDVKIQVDFEPDAVRRYRLVGYENRDIADRDFRNDAVDAGEVGAGHTVTALYEVELQDDPGGRIATVRVRHKEPHGSNKATEQSFTLDRDELRSSLAQSSDDLQFAASVAAFAEKLRRSPYARDLTYDWILEIAEGATRGRSDRKEFIRLVKKARRA